MHTHKNTRSQTHSHMPKFKQKLLLRFQSSHRNIYIYIFTQVGFEIYTLYTPSTPTHARTHIKRPNNLMEKMYARNYTPRYHLSFRFNFFSLPFFGLYFMHAFCYRFFFPFCNATTCN